MNFKFFLNGIKNIILDPAKAWESIDSENKSVRTIRNSIFIPLIILVSISCFFGSLIYVNPGLPPVYSVFVSIKCFVLLLITVYGTALILTEITYALDLGKDFHISFRLVVYSMIPFLLCQILSRLFESLLFVNIIGLYGLYIFWSGVDKMLSLPQYKKMPMLIATTISMVVIYLGSDYLLSMLIKKVYYAIFS
jgi:hypothetical protein